MDMLLVLHMNWPHTSCVYLHCTYVNVCMDMVSGHSSSSIGFLGVVATTVILFVLSRFCVLKMWDSMGGVKL